MHLKESYEIRETLIRLEQKVDILLAKFNSLEQRKKFITVTTETPEKIVNKEPKPIPTFVDALFKDELIRRVEELRAIRQMGESHGFEPTTIVTTSPDQLIHHHNYVACDANEESNHYR